MASVAQYLTTLAGASGANAEALRAAAQMQIELKSGDPRNAITVCMQLVQNDKPIEARHFGYGVLQFIVNKRFGEFSDAEKHALASLCYDKLREVGNGVTIGVTLGVCTPQSANQTTPEPFLLKSKVATLMAHVVRQQGAKTWQALVPDLANGAASENPGVAEISALTMRYVAEDVAVHNADILGGRMKELLFGLTSTLPQTLPALYRSLEIHFAAAVRCASSGDAAGGKARAGAVVAALGAAATYCEWAPLAPLFRSGLLDACGHFLSSSEFRGQACEVLRHVAHRRRGDVVNAALDARGGGESDEPGEPGGNDAADAQCVVDGFAKMCHSIGVAVAQVLAVPVPEHGSEEREYVVRLTETAAAVATNHLHVVPDSALRASFLEALLGLTKYPTLGTLGPAVAAWPGLLRNAGAELPNGFTRPEKASIGSGLFGFQGKDGDASSRKSPSDVPPEGSKKTVIPPECVVALLETSLVWLRAGGGLAAGLQTTRYMDTQAETWDEEFESREELRETWVVLRARLMEVTKLCTFLNPNAAVTCASLVVQQTCASVQPGGALHSNQNNRLSDPNLRSEADDAAGCAFEGATSFVEPVMLALPFSGSGNESFAGSGNAVIGQVMPSLNESLRTAIAVEIATPVGVSHASKLLEALGRSCLANPVNGTNTLNRLFEILGRLPSDDALTPPARASAALMAGRTAQAARQRVCAAVLGVCTAAPQVFNPHLQGFATQVESLRVSGCLSGGERGALAEALLAVAGPSGPARVREVLSWLLSSVRDRWVLSPGSVSPDVAVLASFSELVKGNNGDGAAGLSKKHWELFHDIQLTERCLRRSGGEHDFGEVAGTPAGDAQKTDTVSVPHGIARAVDPPPPPEECPASDHLEWALTLSEAVCGVTHKAWSPRAVAEACATNTGIERCLEMSPDEQAAHLIHGPAKAFALSGGGLAPETQTASSTRSWLRGLRDSAYAVTALLAIHAPASFYASDAVASSVSRAVHCDLAHARDRHARALLHTVVRPILGRCPAAHRQRWHAALTTGLVPHMHERLAAAWDRGRKNSQNDENPFASDMDGEDLSFAAAALAGGGAAAVAELVADRVTRDLTRDHCALLELLAAPEGTFGRKTKGSGLTGHLRHLSGNSTSQDGSQSQNETVSPFEKLAHGGGRHVLGWMAATAVAEGNVGGDRCCRAALGTACAAITWGDSEASGKALGFLRGVVAAAAASGSPDFASLNNVSPMAQTLREDVAGATLSSCLAGLTVPTNSAHQAELLGVIRDVVLSLLPTTIAARATLMSLPGMTEQELDKLLHDLSTIRSEKKAASRVKESLIAAAGDGDALRAFVEARAGASSSGAIQMPSVTNRTATNVHQNDGNKTWSEEDVNGFGLNPLTANTRQAQ